MGCNYFYQYQLENGRCKNLHIGKKSAGWEFSFRGYENIKSFNDWKEFFKEKKGLIFNEYDQLVDIQKFLEMVEESKNNDNRSHYKYCKANYYKGFVEHLWLDEEGWSFSGNMFS